VTRKDTWGRSSIEVEVREKEDYGYEWVSCHYGVAPDIDLVKLGDNLGRDIELEIIDGTVRRVLRYG